MNGTTLAIHLLTLSMLQPEPEAAAPRDSDRTYQRGLDSGRLPGAVRTDAELIALAQRDSEAMAELYRRHVRAIHGWLLRQVPESAASELAAETFAQALSSLNRFRNEANGSAAPWLFGIAHNLVRRYYEKQRIEQRARERLELPLTSYEDEFAGAESDEARAELERTVREALGKLPEAQRRVLELRVVGELPYAVVASRLGCSEVAARIRVMRALGALSRLLRI